MTFSDEDVEWVKSEFRKYGESCRLCPVIYGEPVKEHCAECESEVTANFLSALHAHNWCKLAKDQRLPDCLDGNRPRAKAFRDMLMAGFRKVEEP